MAFDNRVHTLWFLPNAVGSETRSISTMAFVVLGSHTTHLFTTFGRLSLLTAVFASLLLRISVTEPFDVFILLSPVNACVLLLFSHVSIRLLSSPTPLRACLNNEDLQTTVLLVVCVHFKHFSRILPNTRQFAQKPHQS